MSETGICCATCPMFVRANPQTGNCHANPPHAFLIPGDPRMAIPGQPNIQVRAVWTPVFPTDWCSRHPLYGSSLPIDTRLTESAEESA